MAYRLEVFYADYFLPTLKNLSEQQSKRRGSESKGYYWWFVNGNMGDDDPRGPYKTYKAAQIEGMKEEPKKFRDLWPNE